MEHLGSRSLNASGSYCSYKAHETNQFSKKDVRKVLEGAWGNFFQEVPPQKYYANKAYAPKALSVTLSRATSPKVGGFVFVH